MTSEKMEDAYIIENQDNTLPDIERIVNEFYNLGKVVNVERLTMGDSNFNYFVTAEKDGVATKYFGQLFSTSKSVSDLKYELALRKYFTEHNKSNMKCAALVAADNEDGYVRCFCPEVQRERYFCMFTLLPGKAFARDTWAYGKITEPLIKGCAKGIAQYHAGAYGFVPPEGCGAGNQDFKDVLKEFRRMFTEEYERCSEGSTYEYYDYFAEYQPRLLEILDKCSERYAAAESGLPNCMCHIDTSPQNYLLDENYEPVGICDLDISQYRPRLYDIGWFINEALCNFNEKELTNSIRVEDVITFLNAYDDAMEEIGNPLPGKLTDDERKMVIDIFEIVSIHCGFYYIWEYIVDDNPTNTYEFNTFWGNWTKTAIDYVEDHRDAFEKAITA
ncbi:MAG: phosphotransferase [Firmicutes bacterium]|nr:phosphotransferase [Bacillota bacterium]